MNPGTALVLEGGGFRGAFTAGVTDVLMERGVVGFSSLWGVSAGALTGASFASRQIGRAIRVNLAFRDDKRYTGARQLLATGDIVNAVFLYNEVQDRLDPFDYAAFNANPIRFYAVVSSVVTGKPEYMPVEKLPEQTDRLRASASLPVLSRIVDIDGRPYLDGGTTDSVPLERALEEPGTERALVVLTRERGYVKKASSLLPVARRLYRDYPCFVEAFATRPERYNAQREYIWGQEAAGSAFVICPPGPVEVAEMERDGAKLLDLYIQGRKVTEEAWEGLARFLGL